MSYEINLRNYTETLGTRGYILREYLSDLGSWHEEVLVNDESDTFYAKGFFREEMTNELYYFDSEFIKIVKLNKIDTNRLDSVTVERVKYTEIDSIKLTLNTRGEVDLLIDLKNGTSINFNNMRDSDEKQVNSLGRQIKKIYKLINR